MTRKPGIEDGSRTGPCTVPGCRGTTREHKPVCVDHLASMPYVRWLLDALAADVRQRPGVLKICVECADPYRVQVSGAAASRYCGVACTNRAVYRRRRARDAAKRCA